jgi:pilus assembly protein CpaF
MSKNDLHEVLGPLSPLFEDPEITEIMVDGPGRILVEKYGKMEDTGLSFKSNDELKEAIKAVLATVDIEMDANRSIYEARLGDSSRMMAILSPTSIHGHSVVFRKVMINQVSWEKLLEYKAVSPDMRDLLQSAINAHVNILVAGGTASGKTTMANRLIELIPPTERVVTAEATHEFQFEHPRAIFLEADETHVSMMDLLAAAAKMRPDWLAIGELSGPEAMRVMQIFSNGYAGITLIHADSLENALTRLEGMCLMANLGLGLDEIRQTIVSALRLVLYQECLEPNRRRKVTKICELRGLENGRYVLQPLARYNLETNSFEIIGKPG